jgi:hypothetical protein
MECERCGNRVKPLAGRCRVCGRYCGRWRAITGWTFALAVMVKLVLLMF